MSKLSYKKIEKFIHQNNGVILHIFYEIKNQEKTIRFIEISCVCSVQNIIIYIPPKYLTILPNEISVKNNAVRICDKDIYFEDHELQEIMHMKDKLSNEKVDIIAISSKGLVLSKNEGGVTLYSNNDILPPKYIEEQNSKKSNVEIIEEKVNIELEYSEVYEKEALIIGESDVYEDEIIQKSDESEEIFDTSLIQANDDCIRLGNIFPCIGIESFYKNGVDQKLKDFLSKFNEKVNIFRSSNNVEKITDLLKEFDITKNIIRAKSKESMDKITSLEYQMNRIKTSIDKINKKIENMGDIPEKKTKIIELLKLLNKSKHEYISLNLNILSEQEKLYIRIKEYKLIIKDIHSV